MQLGNFQVHSMRSLIVDVHQIYLELAEVLVEGYTTLFHLFLLTNFLILLFSLQKNQFSNNIRITERNIIKITPDTFP